MAKLLSCPFCGNRPTVLASGAIICEFDICLAVVLVPSNRSSSPTEVWNGRANAKEVREAAHTFEKAANCWMARATAAETLLAQAVEALEPFALTAAEIEIMAIADKLPHEMGVTVRLGAIRKASEALAAIRASEANLRAAFSEHDRKW